MRLQKNIFESNNKILPPAPTHDEHDGPNV